MTVSIIIPVFNVENYIEECLMSVMAQTFTDYECILIDDCGNDKSIKIAESVIADYQGRATFKICYHDRNRGVSAARNTGLKAATGDYLYFLDSDDKIFPKELEQLVALVKKNPGVDVVHSTLVTDNDKGAHRFSFEEFPEYSNNLSWIQNLFLDYGKRIPIVIGCKLLRKNLLVDNDISFLEGAIHEDVKFFFELIGITKSIAFCKEKGYWYRTSNGQSIMHDSDMSRHFRAYLEIIKAIPDKSTNTAQQRFISQFVYFQIYGTLLDMCDNKDQMLKEFKDAVEVIKHKYRQKSEEKKLFVRTLQLLLCLPPRFVQSRFCIKAFIEISKLLYPI